MSKDYLGGCIIEDNYPESGKGDVGTWAPQVWDKLIEVYQPKSMIDIGCGAGHSTKYFIDKGIQGLGVEGFLPAINSSPIKEHIYVHDYVESEFIPNQEYDLAWCCEFVEHVEEQYSNNFMVTFNKSKVVAMTHAIPGQDGFHHVNCQSAEYWINKFSEFGFSYNHEFSVLLRDLLPVYQYDEYGNITYVPNGGHVKNTLMIFEKN
jgi:major membrane immunogen (membrane-anchored lipoprotein)